MKQSAEDVSPARAHNNKFSFNPIYVEGDICQAAFHF